jgi:hypothetical protein
MLYIIQIQKDTKVNIYNFKKSKQVKSYFIFFYSNSIPYVTTC